MRKRIQIEDLADHLHSAAIRLLRLVRVQDTASGIAPARLSALSAIVFGGPVSLQSLARAEQVKPPTMSRIVDALELDGLARRCVNPQDRRALLIEATEKGAAMLKEGRRRRVKFLASYLSQLNNSELSDIERAVQAIQKALQRH
ncbi:MAG: MarR family transcriptional regulator [Candidatus Sulfotelmatobacter sp.]|jgi:DNA-binding MarR family transcriptional regulator